MQFELLASTIIATHRSLRSNGDGDITLHQEHTEVVEGIMDHITLWQWGYQGVAALGTSIKPQDARRLARAAKVMFVPDSDEAGEAAARWRDAPGHYCR